MYAFSKDKLTEKVETLIDNYNFERFRLRKDILKKTPIDGLVNNDHKFIKWTDRLKSALLKNEDLEFRQEGIRKSLYRPFTGKYLYFDHLLNQRRYQQHRILPNERAESENQMICVAGIGNRKDFGCLITNTIPTIDLAFEKSQCFPFYTYDEDGGNRQENITDWALARFREHYGDPSISKWDIFYYVYALLHHPVYRSRYAADLKRQLPRIPLAPDFGAFSQAGEVLAGLHLDYERGEGYELDWRVTRKPISYRVDKMLPQNRRKSEAGYTVYEGLKVNGSLTLDGIPEGAFAYRLGNRSALDWVVDQYRVKTDKRSGIVHNPNGWSDDERYIVDLVERVVGVSLRTVEVVEGLGKMSFGA